jgi:hypothetical protein
LEPGKWIIEEWWRVTPLSSNMLFLIGLFEFMLLLVVWIFGGTGFTYRILFLDDAGYNILILMGKTILQDFL